MTEPSKVLIEFIEVWGHPTRNEIYGPPQRFWVTPWQANHLVNAKYAKLVVNAESDYYSRPARDR